MSLGPDLLHRDRSGIGHCLYHLCPSKKLSVGGQGGTSQAQHRALAYFGHGPWDLPVVGAGVGGVRMLGGFVR
jgi:hypothetical protein